MIILVIWVVREVPAVAINCGSRSATGIPIPFGDNYPGCIDFNGNLFIGAS